MKEEAEEGNVFAEIAPISGHALITADGKMYTYTPEEGVRDGAGTHRGMFLQPAIMQSLGASIKRGWFDDSYPFPIVQERTLWLNRRYRAFSHFVTSVSPEVPPRLRQQAVQFADELLGEKTIFDSLLEVFTDFPPPDGMDLACVPSEGRVGDILRAMGEKWGPG